MTTSIDGKRVAFLAADGVEEVEYTEPRKAVESAGGTAELVSINDDEIQAVNHMDPAGKHQVEKPVKDASVSDYDALVLPGGVANPDFLRTNPDAVAFVREFLASGKTVAAICHAPWTLIEAGAVAGRTLTSWPSLRTDLTNAGATWVDEQVHTDGNLITSRKPDDLPAFCAELVTTLGKA
ncbi:type 1 glutamine amidotransferase domain-containing protein [Paractinoplanes brasiliensis]|uniref:Protease I n=1 Tax=Paractinoplanes brasiliensis TaxID=52695 RepID=A0A4R6JSS8_9ACTN|nr:type 1 glutamine amidotransferase domain-containing protein [Actinoplanes brasiliensis]TDO39157.1 protease I [Actinoplanes brasiliensis]GID30142.1 peptidase C56 PfpI [Actinoplanes brasiliensis]